MTRIPDFYRRRFNAVDRTNDLTCPDCGHTHQVEQDDLPQPGKLVRCPGCKQDSRVPTLSSQAGMADPVEPDHDERS